MANKDSNAQEAWATTRDEHITDFKKGKSGGGLRAAAVILWILGLAAQLSIAVIAGHKVEIPVVSDFSVVFIILAVIISLIASLMGARLWQKLLNPLPIRSL